MEVAVVTGCDKAILSGWVVVWSIGWPWVDWSVRSVPCGGMTHLAFGPYGVVMIGPGKG